MCLAQVLAFLCTVLDSTNTCTIATTTSTITTSATTDSPTSTNVRFFVYFVFNKAFSAYQDFADSFFSFPVDSYLGMVPYMKAEISEFLAKTERMELEGAEGQTKQAKMVKDEVEDWIGRNEEEKSKNEVVERNGDAEAETIKMKHVSSTGADLSLLDRARSLFPPAGPVKERRGRKKMKKGIDIACGDGPTENDRVIFGQASRHNSMRRKRGPPPKARGMSTRPCRAGYNNSCESACQTDGSALVVDYDLAFWCAVSRPAKRLR